MGETPLFKAAGEDHASVVKLLISKGADVNAKDEYGDTPLLVASGHGSEDVAAILLAHGADIEVTEKYGWTQAWITALLGIREQGTCVWDLTKGIRINKHMGTVQRDLSMNDGSPWKGEPWE